MPAVETTPPEKGTYKFVLVNPNFDPEVPLQEYFYDEAPASRAIEFDGKRRPTIFLRTQTGFEAAQPRGWVDITKAWFAQFEPKPVVPLEDRVKVDPDGDVELVRKRK